MSVDRPTKKELEVGMLVEVTKENEVFRGYIKKIRGSNTPKGILVELENGVVGRVLEKISIEQVKRENFIYYNKFLNNDTLFSLYDSDEKAFVVLPTRSGNKLGFAFEEWEDANSYLSKLKKMKPNARWSVRKIPPRRGVIKTLKTAGANTIRINLERTISLKKLSKFEKRVKNI